MAGNDVLMMSVSGCRGIVGGSLSPQVIAGFAAAAGALVVQRAASRGSKGAAKSKAKSARRRPVVVVGRDGRAGGVMVRDAAVAGLTGAGCDVIDLGVAMTPTVGVMCDHAGADAGLVLTASHNPQQWNGLKVLLREAGAKPGKPDACAPAKALAERIIASHRAGDAALAAWDNIGAVRQADAEAMSAHAELVGRGMDRLGALDAVQRAKFSVALDSVNGSGRVFSAAWLEAIGCRVTRVGAEATGVFPHVPEPLAENLKGLSAAVRKAKADVGFAQDPDADRLALIDEAGRYVGEEYTLALAAEAVLALGGKRRAKGAVLVTNLSTSRMLEDVAAWHGARVIRTAVGEANVVEAMKREGSPIGGEGNGGVIWPEVTYIRDSLGSMGLVLGLMAVTGRSLSALVADLPAYAIVKRKVDLPDRGAAQAAGKRVAAAYASERVDTQDGVRVDFDSRRAWLHVRASNTEPIMRLIAEAPSRGEAEAVLDEAAKLIS